MFPWLKVPIAVSLPAAWELCLPTTRAAARIMFRVWIIFCYWLHIQFAKEKVDNPWRHEEGNLNSFGLDLAGYDSAKQAAVLRKKDAFEVEFSADQASVVVRCFSDSFSTSQPNTLCGENQHRDKFKQTGQSGHYKHRLRYGITRRAGSTLDLLFTEDDSGPAMVS